jgi:hypothetical protein
VSDSSHDPDRLSARLAAVERALTARDCDCAHDAFETGGPTAEPTAPDPAVAADPDLHAAVDALCGYVLAHERASGALDEHVAAVAAARAGLSGAPEDAIGEADTEDGGGTDDDVSPTPRPSPREWLERVTAATFE